MSPEGTSGPGMLWVGKGALPWPVGAVPGVVRLPSGGGSLLLAAVPSSAIAFCLPLAPRGAAGVLAEKGGSVRAALRGEILERERRGWSILGAVAKLVSTAGRPQPLRLGGPAGPCEEAGRCCRAMVMFRQFTPEGLLCFWNPFAGWLRGFGSRLLLQHCLRELLGAVATWLGKPCKSSN